MIDAKEKENRLTRARVGSIKRLECFAGANVPFLDHSVNNIPNALRGVIADDAARTRRAGGNTWGRGIAKPILARGTPRNLSENEGGGGECLRLVVRPACPALSTNKSQVNL